MIGRRLTHPLGLIVSIFLACSLSIVGNITTGQERIEAGHVLNRIGYGPSPVDLAHIQAIGVQTYIEEQLAPESIDESDNITLTERMETLFTEEIPYREDVLIEAGQLWRYFKGTEEPPSAWIQIDFNDSTWLQGATGIGYGDGDDRTVLEDMRRIVDIAQSGYSSVYLRQTFSLAPESLASINNLVLLIDYDDGFKAYLNGTEVARANLPAGQVAYNATANGSHEAGTPVDFDISAFKNLLVRGDNVLAIQVHNTSLTSSDLSMIPELLSRETLPGPARRVIGGIDKLQQLVHIRGVYSRKQLQAVLGEFWENHFTTDFDKVVEYLDALQNSDASDAMPGGQVAAEAAQAEYQEYEFLYEHALGNFGDLLLYSATSPTMLIYLDNVLNVRGQANENYAREILELHSFGVDNRYTQKDIEQLAKCFTGWAISKVPVDSAPTFPDSALDPPAQSGIQFEDTVVLDLGQGWKYFKGTQEPTPGSTGNPTTDWTQVGFNDANWFNGATGIGYGDGDDATVLSDMQNRYMSVYLRRTFTINDPSELENLILSLAYDDGFVAYLNGLEVARSESMEDTGAPPAYNQEANDNHEVSEGVELFNLSPFRSVLKSGQNVLAIQVHNTSIGSSDLSILPRLIDRTILPGSVENGDRNAIWTFYFDPALHDTSRKVLFEGTEYEIVIPAGREGRDGLIDALDVVEKLTSHPSTAEFICIKLIQKFVSDEITLATYKDGTAPTELRTLLNEAMTAWNSTTPSGNIALVMETILDPANRTSLFWSETAYRTKVKTAIEYINSSLRILEADASGTDLAQLNNAIGMELFTRDDPDGYSELGTDWIDTATMLERIEFVSELAENRNTDYTWDTVGMIDARDLQRPEQIVDFFNEILYQGMLSETTTDLLLQYLTTDQEDQPTPLDRTNTNDYRQRIEALIALMLSLPQWHYQ